ncbi:hypothetical protein Syun_018313 [Stephania yunnanensis]|uniref:protein-tyrosine-phosphatase n=1 Tax=Stephania yunnanensis TaxID=152371 RepID=A0AAP0IS28_9MAGN
MSKVEELLDTSLIHPWKRAKIIRTDAIEQKINVYIWDMDETLILLKSLLNGTYAEAFNGSKDVQKGKEIGRMWEDHLLRVCDDYFFYEQIENCNKPSLDALSDYDDGRDLSDYDFGKDRFTSPYDDPSRRKLAYRYRVIAHKYVQGLRNVLDEERMKQWDDLYHLTDIYTDRWLSSARAFLEQSAERSKILNANLASSHELTHPLDSKSQNIHVLVTSGSLVPSLVKCLLFRLDDLMTHQNVYSSWDVGKLRCFSLIKERFSGSNAQFCVIGDGWEECEAAESMKWPFVKIDFRPGSSHKFPGLTLRTVDHYIGVIYENSDAAKDEL